MPGVRGRRYLVILAVLAGLVGLYAAVGFLLVPRWTRSELVQLTARDFGRTLSIGDVSFNPFTWTLRISDLSFPDSDGRPMISFGRLEVELGISSVPRLAPSFTEIALDRPHVNTVVRRDGTLNLADLEKPFAQPAKANAPPASSGPFKLFVDRLAVANGSATYEDDSRSSPFRLDLEPIGFELLDFNTAGDTAGSYRLTATISQGGRLDWTGTVRATPLSLHGSLDLDGLSATTVGAYLGPILPAEISRGTASLQVGFAIDSGARGPRGQGSAAQGLAMTIDVPAAQVSELGLRPRRGPSDYVELNRLALANTHIDLGQHSIRVGRITLARADIRGWLDRGGQLNLLELLGQPAGHAGTGSAPVKPHAGAEASAAPASPAVAGSAAAKPSATTWRIAAPDIRIEDSRLSLEDREVKPAARVSLAPLSARITGYDTTPGSRITVSLESAVNRTGQIRLNGDGTLQPESVSAKLDVSRIDLRAVQPYLNKYSALTLASGTLSTSLDLQRRADAGLSAAGRFDVSDLRAVDDALKQDFVKWRRLHIAGFRYRSQAPGHSSLHIDRIIAIAPYARVIIGANHTLNVSEALHPRGYHPPPAAAAPTDQATEQTREQTSGQGREQASAQSRSATASMPITIGLVRIANGTADYADFSMQPNFATGIQDLHGTIKGLSSDPSTRAEVDLQGSVNAHAPVDITGVVNLLSASTYTDIRMRFRGLELTQMTPYSVRFAGYKIASGTLDADLHYKVDHSRLNADHTLVIDQLQLGDQVASPHATRLPLRLAVALLKDRNGVIRLGLPVTGSLSDPHFSLGPLLGKALLAVIKKAVTAPFAMLGRLFGGGPDIDRIEFAPGSATLLPAARARVAAVGKALAQRPQLQLEVPAAFAADVDRPALAQRRLREELLALARGGALNGGGQGTTTRERQSGAQAPVGREVLELPAAHYRLLRAAYQRAFGPKAQLPAAAQKVPPFEPAILEMQSALLKQTQVSDADLQALARKRAEAIRSAVLSAGGVDAGRVGIASAAPQSASAGKVAVRLGLK